jgi:serine protease AprX
MNNWTSSTNPDFDLLVYNPSGTLVKSSQGVSRQETVTFNPTVTGTYNVTVKSYTGTGAFMLDISSK